MESATVVSRAVPEFPVLPMGNQAGLPWAGLPWALGRGVVGYGGVLGGAGAFAPPYGQSGGFTVGPRRGF